MPASAHSTRATGPRRWLAARRAALLRLPDDGADDGGPHGAATRWRAWRLALVVLAVQQIGSTFAAAGQAGERGQLDVWARLLLACGPVLLLLRHRYPRTVVWSTAVVTAGYLAAGYPYGPVFLSFAVACVSASVHGRRYAAWGALGLGWLAQLVVVHGLLPWPELSLDRTDGWAADLFTGAWVLALVALGELGRVRRAEAARRRRAAREAAQRRADEERLRIARELHDVLAHSISVINVQAGMGLALLDSDPEQARTALTTIRTSSKEALDEVRHVLETLRAPGDAPRTPAPGLARLDELVAQAGRAGLDVAVETEGEPRTLPPTLDLAAFRLVQEALTNTVRHSAARTARVQLGYQEGELTLTVDDPGPAAEKGTGSSGGNGLVGIRERVAALHGELTVGPRPDGGFRVRARLPVPDAHGSVEAGAGGARPREEEP